MHVLAPLEMGSLLLSCWSLPAWAHQGGSACTKPSNFGSELQVKRLLISSSVPGSLTFSIAATYQEKKPLGFLDLGLPINHLTPHLHVLVINAH